ncbi:ribosome hibernation-promoting factor, HPF/YfiA family [Garciella nitratireducens]|uniref:Ribosome hibernation promoting factor n=1 Tax=Garciella nitratireducens DSM 15102 TaxID=1121911 RepID=A0A1T4LVD1_9FIRM|nr:ribosome-associated translation inhibitor RaiA [Garciella nitratireducens]SJZ58591.1 putative sigma-54 modulation protein [Garciella nitratireducens DSM 15102]
MHIIISGKNLEVTDGIKNVLEKKLQKLDKYFDPSTEVRATLSVEKNRHILEVTIPINGAILRAEEETDDMYNTIDEVMEKLERQIRKYRTKIEKKMKKGSFRYNFPLEEQKEKQPKIVRTKKFAMKPMPVEEALLQMELLGHNFFVFLNAENDEVNVVYKRKDGNYGLIEPTLS